MYKKRQSKKMLIGFGVSIFLVTLILSSILLVRQVTHAAGVGDSGVKAKQTTNNQAAKYKNDNDGMNNKNGTKQTIRDLFDIREIGSTAFIVDDKGNTISADANPYDVAIAPSTSSMSSKPDPDGDMLNAGDLVVTNFGGNQTGKTLVRFPDKSGPGHLFNHMGDLAGLNGPADEAFNTNTGTLWVSNFSGNNVLIFSTHGDRQQMLTSSFIRHPFGMAFNGGKHNTANGSIGAFFISNSDDASIVRVDIVPTNGGTSFKFTQIGRLTSMGKTTFSALKWVRSLHIQGREYDDVLVGLDPANNRVAAFPNSSTRGMNTHDHGITVFQGTPLNAPGGLAINPINGDLLAVNGGDNKLVELNAAQGKVVGTRVLDNVPVDAKTGNGAALFGVAATTDTKGNLVVFFTDDNTNTLDVLR